jgi:riboflavin kinase/FMN adenylyltransferase
VHILDFNQDIYGETIHTQFLKRIRNEKKFNSKEELIVQIKTDLEYLRKFISD